MSAVGSTPADGAADGIEGVDTIMRRGGEALRARMVRAEAHLERVTAQAGAPLAAHANATIRAGGKRLRPLLVVLAAESAGGPPPTKPTARSAWCARRWRSSWCTRRRSCTTT